MSLNVSRLTVWFFSPIFAYSSGVIILLLFHPLMYVRMTCQLIVGLYFFAASRIFPNLLFHLSLNFGKEMYLSVGNSLNDSPLELLSMHKRRRSLKTKNISSIKGLMSSLYVMPSFINCFWYTLFFSNNVLQRLLASVIRLELYDR